MTLSERLRWQSEVHVAAARGLLIAEDPEFRRKQQEVSERVNALVRDLRRSEEDPRANRLLDEVAHASTAYDERQAALLKRAGTPRDRERIALSFERDLMPLRTELDAVTDRYVERERELLMQTYARIEGQRTRARVLADGSLLLAGLIAFALFWYMSRALARTYVRERAALDRAEEAVAARDQVLGIVAHDLRNPLSAIAMKAAVLKGARDPDAMARHAASIQSTAARMDRLIASLLDVASIEAGKLSTSPSRCPVEPLLREVTSLFDTAAAERSVRLETTMAEPELTFYGDRERVFQVLSNLVGNALKFTPAGGEIGLRAEAEAGAVRLSVSDSGPGIEVEWLPHVFDRFWKKDGAAAKGTGLGLFICKGIVEAHGGRIWVESRPGHGATFRFTLPAAAEA